MPTVQKRRTKWLRFLFYFVGSFFPRPKLQEVLESTATVFLMRLKVTIMQSPTTEEEPIASGVREPVVTFVEPDQMPKVETIEIEPTPSVQSASAMSDVTDVTKPVDGELTTTAPSLFDNNIGMPGGGLLQHYWHPSQCYPRSHSNPPPELCARLYCCSYI